MYYVTTYLQTTVQSTAISVLLNISTTNYIASLACAKLILLSKYTSNKLNTLIPPHKRGCLSIT